jgi:hypothetical protein
MTQVPDKPKLYHITHIKNLEGILDEEVIWSDAKRLELGLECEIVGMSEIKRRRLEELEVICHSGTMVGEYVPFYFCPRSIMLYILYMGNHPDITYHGGQRPILHLQADLETTVQWAEERGIRWAFSDRNAGEYFAQFYNSLDNLNKINWSAVEATDFRDMLVKEGKQAEFLMYESFPLELVEKIGICDSRIRDQVVQKLDDISIPVSIETNWYY